MRKKIEKNAFWFDKETLTLEVIKSITDMRELTDDIVSKGNREAYSAKQGWRFKSAGDKQLYMDRDSAKSVWAEVINELRKVVGGISLLNKELQRRAEARARHSELQSECEQDCVIPEHALFNVFLPFAIARGRDSYAWKKRLQEAIFSVVRECHDDLDLMTLSNLMEPYRSRCPACMKPTPLRELGQHNHTCMDCEREREKKEMEVENV